MRIKRPTTRTAFTLVELLVAMALILFIMSIMAQAFASGGKVFTGLRTVGQLQEKLRGGITILRRDLANDHFGPPYGPNRGGPHLGDQRLDQAGWSPPYAGYVEISQGLQSGYEPSLGLGLPNGSPIPLVPDGEGLYSTRNVTCIMRFTIRLPDGPAPELYSARYHPVFVQPALPNDPTNYSTLNAFPGLAPVVYTRWAEVCYFLVPRGTTAGGLPTFSLNRRVRLLPPKSVTYVLNSAELNQLTIDIGNNTYPDMVNPIDRTFDLGLPPPPYPAGSKYVTVPGPEMINTNKSLRITATPHPTGDDVLMTDVISFEIKAAWFNNPSFNTPPPFAPGVAGSSPPGDAMPLNSDEPFSDIPASTLNPTLGRTFDTWYQDNQTQWIDWESPLTYNPPYAGFLINTVAPPNAGPLPPLRINVRALQIKLRTWDPRAEQARQATVIQDL
jgi:hypothetical protein